VQFNPAFNRLETPRPVLSTNPDSDNNSQPANALQRMNSTTTVELAMNWR